MKNIYATLILIIATTSIVAQTRKMNNTEAGRTYTVQNQSRSVQPLLLEAERQFRKMDLESTFLTLESAVAQNPYSSEALILRARVKKMIGMQNESEADIRLASAINPLAVNLYGYYGNGGLLKILSIEPKDALSELSTFQKLDYYYQLIDQELLASNLQASTTKKVSDVLESIERDELSEALDILNSVDKSNINHPVIYDLKGLVYKLQNNLDLAEVSLKKAIDMDPDYALAWFNFAQIEIKKGAYKKAKIYLDRAIQLKSNLTKAYFERAMVSKKLNDYDSAIEDYNKIIEIGEASYELDAYLNRGLTKKLKGDYIGALADIDEVIEAFPYNAELLKTRGNLYILLGLPRKAIDNYTDAILLKEDFAEAYYNRGLAHFVLYDKISGCADLDQSIDLDYTPAIEAQQYFCTQF